MSDQETKTRRPQLRGKKLFPNAEENPHREGSKGHISYQIIDDNPGIAYEEFIAAGGSSGYAQKQLELGQIRVE